MSIFDEMILIFYLEFCSIMARKRVVAPARRGRLTVARGDRQGVVELKLTWVVQHQCPN